MCEPVTAITAASAGIGLLGSGMKFMSEGQAADQKAEMDRQNQQLAEAQASDAIQRGSALASRLRTQAGVMRGAQRAGYAASGVDENVGTAADVQAQTTAMGALDARTAQNNAAREAWGFKVHAAQYGAQAELDKTAGDQEQMGTLLGGLGQLGSGVGATYSSGANAGLWGAKAK